MESALIVSSSEASITFFNDMLSAASIGPAVVAGSCAQARRLMLARDFDLVIVNAPLRDETGEALAREVASSAEGQVILVVKAELFDALSAACEEDGVLTIARPVNRHVFWSALKLARAAHNRLSRMRRDNRGLMKKIEDIRVVDRAKCLLISYLGIGEAEAHRYIEKQAMDTRETKRAVAESILKMYEP